MHTEKQTTTVTWETQPLQITLELKNWRKEKRKRRAEQNRTKTNQKERSQVRWLMFTIPAHRIPGQPAIQEMIFQKTKQINIWDYDLLAIYVLPGYDLTFSS